MTRTLAAISLLLMVWAGGAVAAIDAADPPGWLTTLERYTGAASDDPAVVVAGPWRAVSRATTDHRRQQVWLRLVVHNASDPPVTRWLQVDPVRLQRIDYYRQSADGRVEHLRSGARMSVDERPINHRQLLLPLTLAGQEHSTLLVRVHHQGRASVHLRLWQPDQFLIHERRLDFFNTLQFGALAWLAVFGLLAWLVWRQADILFLALFTLCGALVEMTYLQYGRHYVWGGAVGWDQRALVLSGGLILPLAGLLMTRLLRLWLHAPLLGQLLRGLSLLLALIVVARACGYRGALTALSAPGSVVLMLLLALGSVWLAWRNTPAARLWLGAFLPIWIGALYGAGRTFGWWSVPLLNGVSAAWLMLLGVAGMGLVLTRKMRAIRQDRALAVKEARRAQLELTLQQLRTRELRLEKEAVEQSVQAKSTFLAKLSHELRTPLHSILGYSGLIINQPASTHEQQRRGRLIRRSGEHLLGLIDDLLDHARADAPRSHLNTRWVLLEELFGGVIEELLPLAERHGAVLQLQPVGIRGECVQIDPLRLRQVLINLITNACRHSGAEKITVRVTLTPAEPLAQLAVTVEDDGAGIPDSFRERLFEPFEQARPGASDGLGLGLSIARQWVEAMGGRLQCDRPPAGGTRFQFGLAALRQQRQWPQPSNVAGGLRVLVVDDIDANRQLLVDALRAAGHHAVSASHAAQVKERLLEQRFDVVVTEWRLPDCGGEQLLLQARAAGYSMPWVLVTAATEGLFNDGRGLGFQAVLRKPVAMDLLLDTLRAVAKAAQVVAQVDAAALAELRSLVQLGAITDIEHWADAWQQQVPGQADYAEALRLAARQLDMFALQRLAGL